MVPSAEQTGCSKGCNETAQKLKGNRLKFVPALASLRAFAPAAALKESSEDHSLWVIYTSPLVVVAGEATAGIETYVQLVSA